jgi:hypothetical protein
VLSTSGDSLAVDFMLPMPAVSFLSFTPAP